MQLITHKDVLNAVYNALAAEQLNVQTRRATVQGQLVWCPLYVTEVVTWSHEGNRCHKCESEHHVPAEQYLEMLRQQMTEIEKGVTEDG